MPLQARCHSLRPERMSSWLAFFELTPRSRRGGHFLVVGPGDETHPEGRETALRAGQAAVRYFKETPDGAPAPTLLEGVAAVVRHESARSGIVLEYGCGVLMEESIWVLTRGRVRLVLLAPHLEPPSGADEPREIPAAAQGRVFFGRLPVEFDDPRVFRDMAARLEQAGGGDGGLLISFQNRGRPRGVETQEGATPALTLPLFGEAEAEPAAVDPVEATLADPIEVTPLTPPPTSPPPRSEPPVPPPVSEDTPSPKPPSSPESQDRIEEEPREAVVPAEELFHPTQSILPPSTDLEDAIAEVEAEAATLTESPEVGEDSEQEQEQEQEQEPEQEPEELPAKDEPAKVFAPEETRGLGFWLGLVAVILVLGAGITYFGFVRGRLPSPQAETPSEGPGADPTTTIVADPLGGVQITPRTAWTETFSKPVTSSPLILDDKVIFGCRDGNVYALDRATGRRVWAYGAPDGFGSSPAAAAGLVFIGGYDGKLYALDAATGAERWSLSTGGRIVASPVVTGNTVFIGSYDHKLYAVTAEDGTVQWSRDLGSIIWASPVVHGDMVITADLGGKISALELSTGRERWVAKTSGEVYSSPAVGERKIFVGSKDRHIYAFDLEDGAELWKVSASAEVNGSPRYHQGRVVVGTEDGTILGIDVGLGLAVWSVSAEGAVKSRPVFEENRVWITGYDGILRGIEWLTGEEVVRMDLGTSTFSSPALADGNLFFGGMDGSFFSISLR